jgi:hypothetical protein
MKKEYQLTLEYFNGVRYVYYGSTKKECLLKARKVFGNLRGFVKKEWEIIND